MIDTHTHLHQYYTTPPKKNSFMVLSFHPLLTRIKKCTVHNEDTCMYKSVLYMQDLNVLDKKMSKIGITFLKL